ncbi:hypothetical protein F2P56_014952 [Juglans regia]|uniref:Phosphoribosylformylglycinamidine cyclo-ligase-like n=2 Tax=Juglans regia TaxID=51240 RepID=A0A2I4G8H9_JUGRE|nr:phosphoribosylformylglycinamidine cyclo-ligase-like [Juglans regia]KAF5464915.1 hypothetical protein F2P56_014952 [Juglans regia]
MPKNNPISESLTYEGADVDIDVSSELVYGIAKMVLGIGGSYLLVGTHGVRTKLKLVFETGIQETIGVDLVAMSVNNIFTSGLFFLNASRQYLWVLPLKNSPLSIEVSMRGIDLKGGRTLTWWFDFCKDIESRSQVGYMDFGQYDFYNYFVDEKSKGRMEAMVIGEDPVRIAMVGKYTGLSGSYLSVLKALLHASVACCRKLNVEWVATCDLEDKTGEEIPYVYKIAWNCLNDTDRAEVVLFGELVGMHLDGNAFIVLASVGVSWVSKAYMLAYISLGKKIILVFYPYGWTFDVSFVSG